MFFKVTIGGEKKDAPEIVFKDMVVIRHSSSAYQVYLQDESEKTGHFIEVFEVFIHPDDQSRVF